MADEHRGSRRQASKQIGAEGGQPQLSDEAGGPHMTAGTQGARTDGSRPCMAATDDGARRVRPGDGGDEWMAARLGECRQDE